MEPLPSSPSVAVNSKTESVASTPSTKRKLERLKLEVPGRVELDTAEVPGQENSPAIELDCATAASLEHAPVSMGSAPSTRKTGISPKCPEFLTVTRPESVPVKFLDIATPTKPDSSRSKHQRIRTMKKLLRNVVCLSVVVPEDPFKWSSRSTGSFRPPKFIPCKIADHQRLSLTNVVAGEGSGGVVKKGYLEDTSKSKVIEVAVKVAAEGAEPLLKMEADVYLKLGNHPHIPEFHAYTHAKYPDFLSRLKRKKSSFLVLEWLPHELGTVLHKEPQIFGSCSYKVLLEICLGVAKGMQFLHSQNIIHRDLKPCNILLTSDLVPKLTDFGLAKMRPVWTFTTWGGTIGYSAPEVASAQYLTMFSGTSKSYLDKSIDIYSYGVTMWEVMNRCEPYNIPPIPDGMDDSVAGYIHVGNFFLEHVVPQVKPCYCLAPVRNLIEECLRFDALKVDNHDHGRPSFNEIVTRIEGMMHEYWVDQTPPQWQI